MSNLPHNNFYYSNTNNNNKSYEGFENKPIYQKYEPFDSQPEDVFTLFYKPSCEYSTRLKPIIQQTLGGIATEYVDYKVGNYNRTGDKAVVMVDVDRYPGVVRQFNIERFPTLKLLRGVTDRGTLNASTVVNYGGPPAVSEIDTFIRGGVENVVEVGVPNVGVPNVGVPNVGVPNIGVPNVGVPNIRVPNVVNSSRVSEFVNSQPEDVFAVFYQPNSIYYNNVGPVINQTLGGIATEYVDYRVGNYRRYQNNAVVAINVNQYPEIVRRFNIQSFPSFKLLRGVTDRVSLNPINIVDYSGPPVVSEIDTFIRNGVSNIVDVREYFDSPLENAFTLFYTPNCRYCKDVIPTIQQTLGGIAVDYRDYTTGNYRRYDNNAVVMVNVDQYPELVQRYNIQSYPTFKLLRGVTDRTSLISDSVIDYNGGRSVQEFDTFIRE